jgi:hypothetical protein
MERIKEIEIEVPTILNANYTITCSTKEKKADLF